MPSTNAAVCAATRPGSAPNERTPMTGFAGLLSMSADGREVEVDAALREHGADAGRDPAGQAGVVDRAERRVARVRRAGARLDPGDDAALLVGGDEHRRVVRPQGRGEGAQLLRAGDVRREQQDPAQAVIQPPAEPVGRLGAGEPGEQAAVKLALLTLKTYRLRPGSCRPRKTEPGQGLAHAAARVGQRTRGRLGSRPDSRQSRASRRSPPHRASSARHASSAAPDASREDGQLPLAQLGVGCPTGRPSGWSRCAPAAPSPRSTAR